MKKIIELIEKVEYVSFDIFDTAILRCVLNPIDVFLIVEKEYYRQFEKELGFDFSETRIEAEKKARSILIEKNGAPEVNLNEIYQCIIDLYDIPMEIANRLQCIEQEVELLVCVKNDYIYDIYRHCLDVGKKVIFTSDMYLTIDIINKILHNAGYVKYEKTFLSSEIRMNKGSGELFAFLINNLNVTGNDILHVGDNYQSDIIKAEEAGINTYYYKKCYDVANDKKNVHVWSEYCVSNELEKSIYQAIVTNKIFSARSLENSENFWYNFGYKNAGIFFKGFIIWLRKKIEKRNVEKVLFLARDGYIMEKVWTAVNLKEYGISASLIHASRRLFFIPSITEINDQTLNLLMGTYPAHIVLSVKQFVERAGLDINRYISRVKKFGFVDENSQVCTYNDYLNMKKFLLSIKNDILMNAKKEREILFQYFDSLKIKEFRCIAIVDVGWHASSQNNLIKLLNMYSPKTTIEGYYVGLWSKANDVYKVSQNMEAYLMNFGKPNYIAHTLETGGVEIIEFLFSAPYGSVIKLRNSNGKIEPELDNFDCKPERLKKINSIQTGALDFIKDFMRLQKKLPYLMISKEMAFNPLQRVIMAPSLEESYKIGQIEFASCMGKNYEFTQLAAPYLQPLEILNKSFWKAGARKLLENRPRFCKTKVAIIMRTKDRPVLLRRAIRSVIKQSFTDWQLIIVNDGGNEALVKGIVFEFFEELLGKYLLLHNHRSNGMESASNQAIHSSESDYIVVHDDDDSWHTTFLEKCVEYLENSSDECAGVVTYYNSIFERIENNDIIVEKELARNTQMNSILISRIAAGNIFPPICFVFKKMMYDEIGGFNERLPVLGDWEFNLRLIERYDIDVIPEPLAYHHQRVHGEENYLNSTVYGEDLHKRYNVKIRNDLLRKEIREGKIGIGFISNFMSNPLFGRGHSSEVSSQTKMAKIEVAATNTLKNKLIPESQMLSLVQNTSGVIKNILNKEVIIFGTGTTSKLVFLYLQMILGSRFVVKYFLDNDHSKVGQFHMNLPIFNSEKLLLDDMQNKVIIIASQYVDDIAMQLNQIGIEYYINGYMLDYEIEYILKQYYFLDSYDVKSIYIPDDLVFQVKNYVDIAVSE